MNSSVGARELSKVSFRLIGQLISNRLLDNQSADNF